jgi:predicted transcriptional regulator
MLVGREVTSTGDGRRAVTRKQQILQTLASLPDDASIEEAIDRLSVLAAIERGMQQIEAGEGITHEEAKRRLAKWLV